MIIGHWQTVSIFSSCHAPLSSTTSLHFHPRPSRPSSPTNCLMKDPTCSSTWAIVHGPSLGNSTVKNMARIDVLCKKKQWSNGGQYQQYLIILYHIIICLCFFLCLVQNYHNDFLLHKQSANSWEEQGPYISSGEVLIRRFLAGTIPRSMDVFMGTSTIDGGLNRTIHRKWSFEEDNL